MQITITDNLITVYGKGFSINDVSLFKEVMDKSVKNIDKITIEFHEAIMIPSEIIGFLLKMIFVNKKDVTVIVYKSLLFNTLEEIQLTKTLNVIRR